MTTLKYRPENATVGAYSSAPSGAAFRGDGSFMLRPDELRRLEHSFDFRCRHFNLGDPQDLADYVEVCDRIVNRQMFQVGKVLEQWCEQTQSFHVLLRWAQPFAELPARLRRAAGG